MRLPVIGKYFQKNVTVNDDILRKIRYRESVADLVEHMKPLPGYFEGNSDVCPLKHSYAHGVYIREIFMPKGTLIVSKIHKYSYPYFVLKGRMSIWTEEGEVEITAPYQGITTAGTQRVLFIHEDTTWINVHSNPKEIRDYEKIEDIIFAESYDEIPDGISKIAKRLKKEEKWLEF
jgi:hypothetical protein